MHGLDWFEDTACALLFSRGWKEVRLGVLVPPYPYGEPWPADELSAYDYLFYEFDHCLAPLKEWPSADGMQRGVER
jgi:hypothetical protein